jgi:NitT/TauT family transport system substrate-binding protein
MSNHKVHWKQRGSAAGNIVTLLLLLGIIGLGVYLWLGKKAPDGDSASSTGTPSSQSSSGDNTAADGDAPTPIEPVTGTPPLEAAATYTPKDGVLQIDISEYAGYGGLIVANGGMEPNPDSFFAKEYGFKVKITQSESETWSALNNGRLAATATTADSLAVLGRQFDAVVPVQISYSRGADMVVVDRGVTSVNQLAGKVLAASQFNESEFFIRYLAQEAGVPVTVLRDLDSKPGANELGLVFYEDAFVACDAYEHELSGSHRLNGCVGWTPRTDEVVEKSNGAAKVLTSNRNLLVIADVLAVNGGFAKANPDMVRGLVHGILEGNSRLRDQQAQNIGIVAKAFGWSEEEARDELSRVHLANLPENRAFFSGTIDSAGSFGGIFQSSVLAYGSVIRNPTDASRFADATALDALAKKGLFANQKIAIAPIRSGNTQASLESDPLLSKDIRFFFEANSAKLDPAATQNQEYLDTIKRFLQVSPGSTVVLRGHVDNARVDEFRQQGGEQLVKSMALKAMELSRQRAMAVSDALRGRHKDIEPSRIEAIGRGWEEPASTNSDLNRRVEVQWFTLE